MPDLHCITDGIGILIMTFFAGALIGNLVAIAVLALLWWQARAPERWTSTQNAWTNGWRMTMSAQDNELSGDWDLDEALLYNEWPFNDMKESVITRITVAARHEIDGVDVCVYWWIVQLHADGGTYWYLVQGEHDLTGWGCISAMWAMPIDNEDLEEIDSFRLAMADMLAQMERGHPRQSKDEQIGTSLTRKYGSTSLED